MLSFVYTTHILLLKSRCSKDHLKPEGSRTFIRDREEEREWEGFFFHFNFKNKIFISHIIYPDYYICISYIYNIYHNIFLIIL